MRLQSIAFPGVELATRPVKLQVLAAILVLTLLPACGATIQPRAGDSDAPQPESISRTGQAAEPIIREVCRVSVRSGWIAVAYTRGSNRCPPNREADNPYNGAMIMRHDQQPLGAELVVCADQPVPRNWRRESLSPTDGECVGARVPEGQPTMMVIRRER